VGAVFTKPADLTEGALTGVLNDRWRFTASSLEYQAVGFGSHHWLVTNAGGVRLFATVDDLAAKVRTADDTTDAAFGRLGRAFATALSLGTDAGLAFVVAPIPTSDGQVLARLTDRYSLVIHPYITGTQAALNDEFINDSDRRAVLDMLSQLHYAHAAKPLADDFVVPHMDALRSMLSEPCQTWEGGPYAERAHELLGAHAADLEVLVAAYDQLARRVASREDRLVITHGEPHAANVMRATGGLVLVDWDTVLLAPPERDLWDMADHDESILDVYASTSGVEIDREALSLYRLWYDLAEISGYLSLFRSPHSETADTDESWRNLKHFLRPADRWPALLNRGTEHQ
jgi:spectinomycin phosphotransferase/16S rRNA (guanine(1405)-N(7))-methyltransferase